MKVYARLSGQETACDETALCERHLHQGGDHRRYTEYTGVDAPVGDYVDCTGNDTLRCTVCGVNSEGETEPC